MHYIKAQNQERAAVCLSSRCLARVSFPALSQIKPQAPLLVVPLPSILLNFSVATHTLPRVQKFNGFPQYAPKDDIYTCVYKMYLANL